MRSGTIAASAWRIGGAGLRCVWGSERLLPVFLFAALFCSGAEAVTPARLFADEREAAETPPSSRLPIDPGREEALARAFRFLDEQMDRRHRELVVYREPDELSYPPAGLTGDVEDLQVDADRKSTRLNS